MADEGPGSARLHPVDFCYDIIWLHNGCDMCGTSAFLVPEVGGKCWPVEHICMHFVYRMGSLCLGVGGWRHIVLVC